MTGGCEPVILRPHSPTLAQLHHTSRHHSAYNVSKPHQKSVNIPVCYLKHIEMPRGLGNFFISGTFKKLWFYEVLMRCRWHGSAWHSDTKDNSINSPDLNCTARDLPILSDPFWSFPEDVPVCRQVESVPVSHGFSTVDFQDLSRPSRRQHQPESKWNATQNDDV